MTETQAEEMLTLLRSIDHRLGGISRKIDYWLFNQGTYPRLPNKRGCVPMGTG